MSSSSANVEEGADLQAITAAQLKENEGLHVHDDVIDEHKETLSPRSSVESFLTSCSCEGSVDITIWPRVTDYLCMRDVINLMGTSKEIRETLMNLKSLWDKKFLEYGFLLDDDEKAAYSYSMVSKNYHYMWNSYKELAFGSDNLWSKMKEPSLVVSEEMLIELAKKFRYGLSLCGREDVRKISNHDQIQTYFEKSCAEFETHLIWKFNEAYDEGEILNMRTFSSCLKVFNGGESCVRLFIYKNPIFSDVTQLFVGTQDLDFRMDQTFDIVENFLNFMSRICKDQVAIILEVFSDGLTVAFRFIERIFEQCIRELLEVILRRALAEDLEIYLRLLTISYQACQRMIQGLTRVSLGAITNETLWVLVKIPFEHHLASYFEREEHFIQESYHADIEKWTKSLQLEHISTSVSVDILDSIHKNLSIMKKNFMTTVSDPKYLYEKGSLSASSSDSVTKSFSKTTPVDWNSLGDDIVVFDRLISVEMAVKFIHLNKDAIRRNSSLSPSSVMGKRALFLFTQLLHYLGSQHVEPMMRMAIHVLNTTEAWQTFEKNDPCIKFLEMVHVVDLVQQCVQAYYEEEIKCILEKTEFHDKCLRKKKSFEKLLDENVAHGMDRTIDVLIRRVKFILTTEQKSSDFTLSISSSIESPNPTEASRKSCDYISRYMSEIMICMDRHTSEVFVFEISNRLLRCFCEHFKKFSINEHGVTQVLCDIELYCSTARKFLVPQAIRHFETLRDLGKLLRASIDDVRSMIQIDQTSPLQLILTPDEIDAFLAKRQDYRQLQKVLRGDKCTIM